jgi:hypothetical protein
MTGKVEVFDSEFRGCNVLRVVDEVVRVVEKCLCFLKIAEAEYDVRI